MKKLLLSLLLTAGALLFVGTGSAHADPAPVAGDANCSGTTDAVDSLQVLRYVSALPNTVCFSGRTLADLDGDSALTAVDADLILRIVSGLSVNPIVPTPVERSNLINSGIGYWQATLGHTIADRLYNVTVYWSTVSACYGYGGCAYINGCSVLVTCKMWVMGDGILVWGYTWLEGVVRHEMCHLVGDYHDGDPMCNV